MADRAIAPTAIIFACFDVAAKSESWDGYEQKEDSRRDGVFLHLRLDERKERADQEHSLHHTVRARWLDLSTVHTFQGVLARP